MSGTTSFTPILNLEMPGIGGSRNNWGNALNANFAALDVSTGSLTTRLINQGATITATVVTAQATANAALPLAGGHMTGIITLTAPTASIDLRKTNPLNPASLIGRNGIISRFQLQLANGEVEAGANAGSNFSIDRFNDAGVYSGSPLLINRASGNVTVGAGGGQLILATEGSAVNSVVTKSYVDTRSVALFGGEMVNQITIRNDAPTIALVDTNNRSGFLHVNDGQLLFLRGDTNSTSPNSAGLVNGRWPLASNLSNGDLTVGGHLVLGSNTIFPGSGPWVTIADGLYATGQVNGATVHSRTTLSAGGQISTSANIYAAGNIDTPNTVGAGFLNSTGEVHAGGNMLANNYVLRSDRALKENIRTLDGALGIISNLRGVRYDLKADGKPQVGLIAQEVKAVMPELVIGDEGSMGVTYANLVAVLIEAVKEMQGKITELEERLSWVE